MPTSGVADQPNISTVPNGAIVPEALWEKTRTKGLANKRQKQQRGSFILTVIKIKYQTTTHLFRLKYDTALQMAEFHFVEVNTA